MNGKRLLSRVDLNSAQPSEKIISLGERKILDGENIITFEVMDTKQEKNVFALDYIRIE